MEEQSKKNKAKSSSSEKISSAKVSRAKNSGAKASIEKVSDEKNSSENVFAEKVPGEPISDEKVSGPDTQVYRQKWLGKINPLPPPKTIQGKLKEHFPEMDDPKFQRAIGMLTATLLAIEEKERRGVLAYKGFLYPCVFAHRKFMLQFGDKIGQQISISVWPTLYAKLPQADGRKKKTLILRVKGLRPEVQEDGYFEVRGIVQEINIRDNKVKVSVREQNRKMDYITRLFGTYSGRPGDFVLFECHLDQGSLYIDSWKMIEPGLPDFVPLPEEKPPSRRPQRFDRSPRFDKSERYPRQDRGFRSDGNRPYMKKRDDR